MTSALRCDVWWTRPVAATPALLALLDSVERERYAGYRQDIDKRRFLTGRALVRAVAAGRLGVEPAAVVLDASCYDCGKPHGKPKVVAAGAPEVSISHSGVWVALAVVDGVPVGVDVEQVRDAGVDDLARLTFAEAERESFDALPDARRRTAFFTTWARKEAVVKATGKGMSIAMSSFTLSAAGEPPRVLTSERSEVDPELVHLTDLDVGPDYRASVAVIGAAPAEGWVAEHDAGDLLAAIS